MCRGDLEECPPAAGHIAAPPTELVPVAGLRPEDPKISYLSPRRGVGLGFGGVVCGRSHISTGQPNGKAELTARNGGRQERVEHVVEGMPPPRAGEGGRAVSRVLFIHRNGRAIIYLGHPSPGASSSLPTAHRFRCGRCGSHLAAYLALLRLGVTVPPLLPAARWALTPPFHPYPPKRAVSFLWPCPSPLGAQALPGNLPCGARTFLVAQWTPRSPHPTSSRQKDNAPVPGLTTGGS